MAYKSESVAVTIKRLNSQFFLPAIQSSQPYSVNLYGVRTKYANSLIR